MLDRHAGGLVRLPEILRLVTWERRVRLAGNRGRLPSRSPGCGLMGAERGPAMAGGTLIAGTAVAAGTLLLLVT
ncbi:hypothetical protein [Alloactinosynnema sp. L-07]|nr:hypothetical protein [Alloactinosynnema sp. L-07]